MDNSTVIDQTKEEKNNEQFYDNCSEKEDRINKQFDDNCSKEQEEMNK